MVLVVGVLVRVLGEGRRDELPVLDPLGGEQAVGRRLDEGRRAAQHDDLQAVVVIEVDVQGRDDVLAEVVLHVGELLGELADVMVIDQGQRGDREPVALEVGVDQVGAHEVAQRLGAVGVALGPDVLVEALQEVTIHRDPESNQISSHGPDHIPTSAVAGGYARPVTISVFDMFSIGIGPSSSHTVGPMRAALRFAEGLHAAALIERVAGLKVELFGSLGHTGKGHGSDVAVVVGLLGERPEAVDPEAVGARVEAVRAAGRLSLLGRHEVAFKPERDLVFHRRETLPLHSNGMRFTAVGADGATLASRVFYSVGGGFVVNQDGVAEGLAADRAAMPHPFETGQALLEICHARGLSVSTVMFQNECAWRPAEEVRSRLLEIWAVMAGCVQRGCDHEGILPGGLKVRRRAPALYRRLRCAAGGASDPLIAMDWVNLFALAVNEENAGGGRVVTAPTNGAAGIIPAVLHYYRRFIPNADDDGVVRFLLTAGAIGILYKKNASISGAEVGCQGEVGVACSMAAGALAEVMGGTPEQVENAAEIGMEHNLGLTCDPIGGLVQVPCIERNAMGSVKAINAARLAMAGDGKHKVSLDKVIATMRQTGADMSTKYKETARGGLAVNIIEC